MDALTTTAARLGRRRFVRGAAGLGLSAAGPALLAGCGGRGRPAGPAPPEPPLETTRLRLGQAATICLAPQYLAQEFLPAEGFTDVSYVQIGVGDLALKPVASGDVDLSMNFSGTLIAGVEAGYPIVVLAGVHPGCFALFGTEGVRAIRDLRGKTVSVAELGGPQHLFLSSMASYVGLDPRKDITWLTRPGPESMRLLAEGQIDAHLAFPPFAQELQAKRIGHVIVDSTMDRPWSQYFCCLVYANTEFAQRHPVATTRALRAILRAADLCAREPERAARLLVDKGFAENYGYALEALRHIPYRNWRAYDPEDTVRFYALRLQEAGLIRSSPQKILAQAADWRFLTALKQEARASTPPRAVGAPPEAAAYLCRLDPATAV
jgi:NitT/TauT family transport system substrate-binding protein